jgi:hypothetical protein
MMKSPQKQVEIILHLNNEPASVGKVMVAATTPNVEILASCFYWQRDGAVVRLVSEDARKTAQALAAAGFQYQTDSVLLIGLHELPGVAAQAGLLLATAGIAVSYSYVSWTNHHEVFAVFKTTDDDRALKVLQLNALVEELAREKRWRVPVRDPAQTPLPKKNTGDWIAARLVARGRHEYRDVADGQWMTGPSEEKIASNPHGGRNSARAVWATNRGNRIERCRSLRGGRPKRRCDRNE